MSAALDRASVERLRDIVSRRLGLHFDDDRLDLLAMAAAERLDVLGRPSFDAYLTRLLPGSDRAELRALAEHLTVGETYFFRSENDLSAFVDVALPKRVAARAPERRLRILSAGCSSGEEAYTLAILLRQVPELASWDVTVSAIDVNAAAVARATAGRYGAWALRQTSPEVQSRFFRTERDQFRVDDTVRSLVTFEERNLVEDDPRFWAPSSFDVVFCRNVIMYLTPDVRQRVVARIASSLVQGGFLFLGYAETLRGISTAFHLRHSHDTFYYELKARPDAPAEPPAASSPVAASPPGDVAWPAAVERASETIASLLRASSAAATRDAGAAAPSPVRSRRPDIGRALDLLHRERFADALASLGDEPLESETDRDALVLRAVLLTSSDDPAAAERVCNRILQLDELNAEAHYLEALCREHLGDGAGAANHDRYAIYLDATFGMPRLHLGLMARRAGDLGAARRELSRALVLLAADDASRILLLGGGFSRDALLDLCRAELRACGGIP